MECQLDNYDTLHIHINDYVGNHVFVIHTYIYIYMHGINIAHQII